MHLYSFANSIVAVVLLVASLFSWQCQTPMIKYGTLFNQFMKNDQGQLRGLSIYDTQAYVRSMEGAPEETTGNTWFYTVDLQDLARASLAFTFEQGVLVDMLSEFQCQDAEFGIKLLKNFKEYFTEHFGQFQHESGYLVWTFSGKIPDSMIVIEMTDESEYSEFYQFSINIRGYKDFKPNPLP